MSTARNNGARLLFAPMLAAIVMVFAYPFAWMLMSAFKENIEIFRPLQFLPNNWSPRFFATFASGEYFSAGRAVWNSAFIAITQAILAVALSSMAGYVFARHRFRGQRLAFLVAIIVIVVPRQAIAIPLFSWLNSLHLTNSSLGVILPGAVSGLGIVFFTQIFRQIPKEYLEVARLGGAPEWRVYLTLLPLVSSALVSFGLIHFILAWHEHLIPLMVLSAEESQTLPLALAKLYGSSLRFPYGVLMAGSVIAIIPPAILFAILHKRLSSSLSSILLH